MNSKNYNVIGVMSGTSLDGVDLAYIKFTLKEEKWHYSINKATTVPYSENWIKKLKEAVNYNNASLTNLDNDYTQLLSGIITNFIAQHNITDLDAVCSHGHTVLHKPQEGITLQIGNKPEIANTGYTTVCDFRIQDVKLGGQGAPLVPIGDRMLFSEYTYCLNLGGFSNISFEVNNKRMAYDICPVNTVLNFYAEKLGKPYDDQGCIAQMGTLSEDLLNELNALEYYSKGYPKSLGIEYVNGVVLPLIEKHSISLQDKLHTFTEHIAYQTAQAVKDETGQTLFITGGSAYNTFLINRLKLHLKKTKVIIPDDKTIQYKEALLFGLLGVLKLRGDINVLSSVTGAKKDHSSGKLYRV